MKAVFDTNVLIDFLNGEERAAQEFARYKVSCISVTTHIEVWVGVKHEAEEKLIRSFLSTFEIVEVSEDIANLAVKIRRDTGMKVPDAIIYATAKNQDCVIVSRNTKDLSPDWPDVRVPYQL